jgi:riboflavin biosynthesis pyrimidine reductase
VLTGIGTVLEDDPRLDVREIDTPRQPQLVLVDSRLRGRIRLKEMEDVAPVDGNPGYQITWEVSMECEGAGKPACVAENVHRRYG